jgi:hypothetical protein
MLPVWKVKAYLQYITDTAGKNLFSRIIHNAKAFLSGKFQGKWYNYLRRAVIRHVRPVDCSLLFLKSALPGLHYYGGFGKSDRSRTGDCTVNSKPD